MGARILVQSGIASGTTHWIERNVVRVGSDPGMDLTLPCDELDKHALTLEYRDGVYRVHNRCSAQVYLGGRTVASGQSDQWYDTDLLELPGLIQLAMEVEGDPAPAPAPLIPPARSSAVVAEEGRIADASAGSPTAGQPVSSGSQSRQDSPRPPQASSSSSFSTMLQVGVIVVCVLGCVLLLARDRMRRSADSGVSVPKFEVIVDQALEQADPATQSLLRHVQYAESAMIRGNKKAARQRYASVRSILLASRTPSVDVPQASPDPLHQQMMQWVEYRLGQL
jgi:hypothetical protein